MCSARITPCRHRNCPSQFSDGRLDVTRALGVLLSAILLFVLGACEVHPIGPAHHVEFRALKNPETTGLGQLYMPEADKHPGQSGFELATSGREAFEGRYQFAALAEKTLDVQYFLWDGDATGHVVMSALLDAADRGVRVRLLLDDLYLEGKDVNLAILDAYPNVHVRLFNPFSSRSAHFMDLLFDFARVNHRMHNKAFVIDNSVAIVGGRNIGDPYFSANDEANFRDVDLFAVGPIVREVSDSFDDFWNSPWATSIREFQENRPSPEAIRDLVGRLDQKIASERSFPFKTIKDRPTLERFAEHVRSRLIWGKATLLADMPDKPETSEPGVVDALRVDVGQTLKHELLLESAYFIPAEQGTERLCKLVARGVRVRILTNSLLSNDEVAAFAGYAKRREDLLRCGVELHELRTDANFVRKDWPWLKSRSEANLHTKAAVFDRSKVLIGSFNMDPRSKYLNTELAVLVESRELAEKVAAFIESGMSLENSYLLELDNQDIVWLARDGDRDLRFDNEPNAGFWRSIETDILSLLPIDELL